MKKILCVLFTTMALVSASFALEVSVGARGAVGGNVGNVNSKYNGVVTGGAFYANLNLFNGFGLQAEIDIVSNTITTGERSITFKPCEIIDIPVMAWYNHRIGNFAIGGGAGLNLSLYSDRSYKTENNSRTNIGFALAGNAKYYFSKMFGIVLGVNSVFDFMPTKKTESSTGEVTVIFGTADKARKAVFGSIGLEVRLF